MHHVTVYSTGPQCMQCRMTMRQLDKAGLTWQEVNLREYPEALAYVQDLGYAQAPVVVVEDGTGEDHWSGFRPDEIARLAQHVAHGALS